MHNYKKLNVWSDAVALAKQTYSLCKSLPNDEKFGLISQMQRASVSIASNIAEGAGRNSNKEFKQFLSFAAGSAHELETQVIIAGEVGFVQSDQVSVITEEIDKILKKLYVLGKSLS